MDNQQKHAVGDVFYAVLSGVKRFIKRSIVRLATRGLITASLAQWLIEHGGVKHE